MGSARAPDGHIQSDQQQLQRQLYLQPAQLQDSGLPLCPNSVTSLDLYQQTELMLSEGVPMATILAQGCGPSQFTLSSGIPLQQARQFDLGVFVQDDWRLAPNLTINAGLRYETQNNIDDHLDLGPRVGLAWAPGAKGRRRPKP